MSDFQEFLLPVDRAMINEDEAFNDFQSGGFFEIHEDRHFPDWEQAQLVLIGTGECRGAGGESNSDAPDKIRKQLYPLYHWHRDIPVADLGNLRSGASLQDTYAVLKMVLSEIVDAGKTVIILGGSHDLTYAQYQAYAKQEKIIEATITDALIDLQQDGQLPANSFLMDMLTEQPNYIRHYSHIGFQSYFVHPRMLETLDKLRFDCYRLGKVRENLEEMEPVLRHADMLSFDMCAVRHAEAPAAAWSPNGFGGDEACALARYAGMSSRLSSFGIYGYRPELDTNNLTALQIAQMIWYFVDGRFVKNRESALHEKEAFWEFHITFTDVEITFLKSKKTARWWMQLPGKEYIPCSYQDYLTASNNDIPERWLRAQERL